MKVFKGIKHWVYECNFVCIHHTQTLYFRFVQSSLNYAEFGLHRNIFGYMKIFRIGMVHSHTFGNGALNLVKVVSALSML